MVSNIAETHKYWHAGGSDRKILGKEKNQILAQGEVYTDMQYIGKLIKTLKVPPTLRNGTKKTLAHCQTSHSQTKDANQKGQHCKSGFSVNI